jgi:FKBP-type peptidyl-prolyl cis-trans isomerase
MYLIFLLTVTSWSKEYPIMLTSLFCHLTMMVNHRTNLRSFKAALLILAVPLVSSLTTLRASRKNSFLLAKSSDRRHVLTWIAAGTFSSLVLPTNAAVTDETSAFANTANDSSYRGLETVAPSIQSTPQAVTAPSDEVTVVIKKSDLSKGLGLELAQMEFRTNTRVFVKSVTGDSVAEKLGIQPNWVVVGVNGESAERTNAEGVAIMVSRAAKSTSDDGSLALTFRNPTVFKEKLQKLSTGEQVTTQVAPAGDTTQRNWDGSVKFGQEVTDQTNQRISVSRLISPKLCNRPASTDDLLEISYLGTVVETGAVFDGSAIRINGEAIPGRGNDVSLFFVLNKQPFGQFPPGWDVGLDGMCVGERRRVIIPPVLAYGSVGVPRRGIPPNATLQYDITLVSLNGLAMPQ